jgi:hypothetical protein
MTWTPEFGASATRLDALFERDYLPDSEQRNAIFEAACRVLAHGPQGNADPSTTGLALGYVQSGKTMSFTALTALAADNGFGLIIALLGSTDLLLAQNTSRLVRDLELETRQDYAWVHLHKPRDSFDEAANIDRYLAAGKTVLITILKNASQVGRTARLLAKTAAASGTRALVIDDEADQISLNTRVRQDEVSRCYEEIGKLRQRLGPFLYTQYTATPFAPLLLEARDKLSPTFVEVLDPGPDYTGGETFFLSDARMIVRSISEMEAADTSPDSVPSGLRTALATFVAGAALVRATEAGPLPVSMLIHPSHLTVVHAHYKDMVAGLVQVWATKLSRDQEDPGFYECYRELQAGRNDLVAHGAEDVSDESFIHTARQVLREAEVWMVNSVGEIASIEWQRSPFHILIGGNKLDRGFTVKGLTVTYMTRRAGGTQADTVEQRARAFGYKRQYLQYCRFFAPPNVVAAFTALVHTEEAMRNSLIDWAESGLPIQRWSEEVGLVLPGDIKPTRMTVIMDPERFSAVGWHTLRKPDLTMSSLEANEKLITATGLLDGPAESFGAISHPVLFDVDLSTIVDQWAVDASPGWEHDALVDYLQLRARQGLGNQGALVLMEAPGGHARVRAWGPQGVPNLMQGSDERTGYPGDRYILPDRLQLQVHRLELRDHPEMGELLALALHIPEVPGFPTTINRREVVTE